MECWHFTFYFIWFYVDLLMDALYVSGYKESDWFSYILKYFYAKDRWGVSSSVSVISTNCHRPHWLCGPMRKRCLSVFQVENKSLLRKEGVLECPALKSGQQASSSHRLGMNSFCQQLTPQDQKQEEKAAVFQITDNTIAHLYVPTW